MKRLPVITIICFCLVLCACNILESTEPAPAPVSDIAVTEASAAIADEEETIPSAEWNIYLQARILTDSLSSREYKTIVYTQIIDRETGEKTTQSLNMTVSYGDTDSDSPVLYAVGSIKARGEIMNLQLYYADGFLYSESGDHRYKEAADFDTAASEADVLRDLRQELEYGDITSLTCDYNADGTIIVNLGFDAVLNGLHTGGTGELVIDGSGYIVSESYTMQAYTDDSAISQSAEVTLMSYGSDMEPIIAPDLSNY